MDDLDKLEIEVRISSTAYVPAGNLSEITGLIERAILEEELLELGHLRNELSEIPSVVYDAVRMKIYEKAGYSFQISYASNGSLVLGGIAVGLCIWLLNQTLGETIKEAWIESEAHFNLKNILKTRIGPRPKRVGDSIKKKLSESGYESSTEIVNEKVTVFLDAKQDKDLDEALQEKQRYRER